MPAGEELRELAAPAIDAVAVAEQERRVRVGEIGLGCCLRAPLLAETWPAAEVKLFEMVKSCFDPDGILNPGVKIPLGGQKPIADVKYDPTLPSLPLAARKALDFIAAERAYATPRLSLIDRAE